MVQNISREIISSDWQGYPSVSKIPVQVVFVLRICGYFFTCAGFSVEESDRQKEVMLTKLSVLEQQAYQLAGHPFSLSATDDVSQV